MEQISYFVVFVLLCSFHWFCSFFVCLLSCISLRPPATVFYWTL